MLAIIKTGGKQYIVAPGQKIKIEKIEGKEGEEITFPEVLLLEKDGEIKIGTPFVEGTKVSGKIIKQGKGEKIIVFKFQPATRYKLKKGHRQLFTEVEVLEIRK